MKLPPRYVFLILSGICIILMTITLLFSKSIPVFNTISSAVFVPMERGVNSIGSWTTQRLEDIKSARELRENNEKLQEKVNQLRQQVASLESDQSELENLRSLYKLDQKYESYPKVGARIIASDNSNWYNNFTIDKGSKDGIKVDMNVLAGDGLAGIVYQVGRNYAKVRAIIDDTSYVSAMFSTTADNCIVNGDLKAIADGAITVDHISKDAKINEGDELITSNVSAKFFVHKIIDQVISHGLRLHQHSFHVKLLSFLRVRLICVPRLTNPVPIAEITLTALKLIGVLQITPVLL